METKKTNKELQFELSLLANDLETIAAKINIATERIQKIMTIEPYAEIPISELGLSTRAYNGVVRAGIRNISQLVNYSDFELMALKNMGEKTAREVIVALKRKGYK